MAAIDPAYEELFLGIAHALFVNRLHVLRLPRSSASASSRTRTTRTWKCRDEIDRELIQQAFAYVGRHFPQSFASKIDAAKARWIRLA